MPQRKELAELLDRVAESERPRVVVRWVDEQRPLPEDGGGITIRRVTEIIVTTSIDGDAIRESFEVDRETAAAEIAARGIEVLWRNDNFGR
jgi:hypothetical protein